MQRELALNELVQIRRDIHQHPELAFPEHRTSAIVGTRLSELGIDVHTGIGKTGVVGVVAGRSVASGRRIALRADMDALMMPDHKGVPHPFLYEGRLHGCGHEGHTAMLCGVAEVWGLHNCPGMPIGTVAVRSGECMAAVDYFNIHVIGKGDHGGMPQEGVDSILTASHAVTALQSIAARNVHPRDSAVVGVVKIHGGHECHVHPERVAISGSVRAYKESVRKTIELQVLELSAAVASAFGAAVEIRYRRNYPPSINDAALAQTVAGVAESVVGGGNVLRNSLPSMAAEDFSFFTQERPGCYVWMGNDGDAHSHSLHRPMYDLNDQLLPLGVSYWTELVGRLMPLEHCLK